MAKKLPSIPDNLILNKLHFENCWWETNCINQDKSSLKKRLYFDLFYNLVQQEDPRRAVILLGPRRVGKTVMMYHAIDELLRVKKVRNNNICFINVENPLYFNISLEELFLRAMKAVGNNDPKGWYVFFDEIQYLAEWEKHLKVLVDSYPDTKFIASGSAAAALKIASNESGAGRFTEFMLPPLTFHEYIYLRNFENIIIDSFLYWNKKKKPFFSTNNIDLLNKHFIDYINYGGYPEALFSETIQNNLGRYIKDDIIDKVLLRDLPSLYGIQNQRELNKFFTVLAYYTANELSLESLATTSGINKNTLKKYLEYLEAAFLIKQVNRIDDRGNKMQRQSSYKVYLTNPSLRCALFSPLSAIDEDMGRMVETAIFSQWLHRENNIPCYARWDKGEIDMVGISLKTNKPKWTAEIKWTNSAFNNSSEIKNLISFSKEHNLTDTIVTTIDKWEQREINGVSVNYIPAAIYAYNIGVNTIRYKHQSI